MFIFAKITAIINLVAIAKFFYIIYKALFIFLLVASKLKEKLFRPILTFFVTIEINRYKIL